MNTTEFNDKGLDRLLADIYSLDTQRTTCHNNDAFRPMDRWAIVAKPETCLEKMQ